MEDDLDLRKQRYSEDMLMRGYISINNVYRVYNVKNLNNIMHFSEIESISFAESFFVQRWTDFERDIKQFKKLRSLNLGNIRSWLMNSSEFLRVVCGIPYLTHLKLMYNYTDSIDDLVNLKNLTHLTLGRNGTNDISILASMTRLTYLKLGDYFGGSIKPLRDLALKTLIIGNNFHDTFEFLGFHTNTPVSKSIELADRSNHRSNQRFSFVFSGLGATRISHDDTPPIQQFGLLYRTLEHLEIGEGFRGSIESLQGMPELRTLILGSDYMGHVDVLKTLPKLQHLELGIMHTSMDVKDFPQKFTTLLYGYTRDAENPMWNTVDNV